MSIGTIILPRVLAAKESWQRSAITQNQDLPNVTLYECSRYDDAIGFQISTGYEAIGYLWINKLYANRRSRAEVDLSMLSSSESFPVPPTDPMYKKYHGKGYGLAAYLVGIEYLAERGRTLSSSSKMTMQSISLWRRLEQYGVASCKREPTLSVRGKDGRPDYYRARFISRLVQG